MATIFRVFCFFTCFSFPVTPLLAQKGWQDVVYLKNSSIIRGKLVSGPEGGPVKMQTAGRNLLVFPAADVQKLSRELIRPAFTYPQHQTYLLMTESGLRMGNSANAYGNRKKKFYFPNLPRLPVCIIAGIGLDRRRRYE